MAAIAEGSPGTPVTVKCRIGVDDFDSYDLLHKFVTTVSSSSPTQHFVVHARKATLKGLSPAANRTIPPLKLVLFCYIVSSVLWLQTGTPSFGFVC